MNADKHAQAKRLLASFGEIDDSFLEEEETADIAANAATRRRLIKYRTITAAASIGAASIGIAVTYWLMKSSNKKPRNAVTPF